MTLNLPINIKPINPTANLDERYGNHATIGDALTATAGTRKIGLTVLVNGVEYWFRDSIADGDLIEKLSLKADLNGNATETFEVANATLTTEAVNKGQIDAVITAFSGALKPKGNWNASTNTPDISATTETGYYWIVSVSGTTDIGGITDWEVNDWVVKTATGWAKIDNTDKVTSVNGETGAITDVAKTNEANTFTDVNTFEDT
jgi:hypothetical protein